MASSSSSSSPEITPAVCTETQQSRFSYKNATHEEVLEDLSSRFILNLPDHELGLLERVCFQVEQAHWFYEDFIREENPKFPSLPLKRFSAMLFEACPLLYQWSHDHEQAFNRFLQYKTRVPVCGAIMLNDAMDKCVLVKGWKSSSGWGFPKGKINETEPPPTCAIREVLEETGYNLAGQLDPENVVEMSINEQTISLFIVPGVPEDYAFKTKTRKEISRIEWFKLTDLPTWRRNKSVPGRFYLITPFIGPLKAFINERKHHKPPRKAVKQKKTHETVTQFQSVDTAHDYRPIQESSSQSSSFDVTGPETPSPHSESDMKPALQVEDNRSETNMSEMDPHFARLLGSLALSAAAASDGANEKSTKAAGDEAKLVVSSSATNPDSSDDSLFVSHEHGVDRYEGSPTLPPQVSQQSGVSSQAQSIHEQSTLDSPQSHKTSSTSTIRPKPPVNGLTLIEANLSTVHNDHTPYPTSVLPSPSTQAPRRATSTADISPYLTRATEVPISATRLKQLSLLETVADESARMSSVIAARAAMTSASPVVNGYPLPSMSVPQSMMLANMRNPGVIYSSDYPRVPSQAQPVYNPSENNFHGEHDAFQVRSRTSQSFHRTLTHNPTGSVNIHQNHVLAAMNGSRAPSIMPSQQYGPQFTQHQYPQMHHAGPPIHNVSMQPRYIPPPQMIHTFSPVPQSLPSPVAGPYPSASINRGLHPTTVNPPYNSSLLSILNTRSSQPATVPAQFHQ